MSKKKNLMREATIPAVSKQSAVFELSSKWVLAILFGGIFLAYAQIWNNGLVWDDDPYITLNDAVKEFDLNVLLTDFHVGNFHPLTMLSLAFEYFLVGESSWLYHFNNLWLHALNSFLVFKLILKLNKSTWVALLTSLFFALHPMHVESVAWAAERKDVLYTFFLLLSFLSYLKYSEHKDGFRNGQYWLSLLFFTLSCFSKGMAVVLPALLIVTGWWFLDKKLSVKNLIDKIPYFVITLTFAYIATTAQKDAGADATSVISAAYTASERFRIVAYSFLFYWFKTIAPLDLLPFYPYPPKPNGVLPGIFNLAAFALLLFAGLVYFLGRKDKRIWWAVMFFIIAISTVLQILPVGSAIVADRYYYLSSIGPLFIISLFLTKGIEKANFWKYASFGFVGFCALLTFFQVPHWKNGFTLFTPAEKVYPQDAMVLSNIGWYHLGEKDFPMAKKYLTQADNNGFKNADVCRTIASMYIDEGQFDLALPYIQRAYNYMPVNNRTDWLMALALSKLERNEEALQYAKMASEAEPENNEYQNTYATVLAANGNGTLARQMMDKMIVENPDNLDLLLNRSYSLRQEGNLEQELIELKAIIVKAPDYLPAYKNIGVTLTQLGRNNETISFWGKAALLDSSGDYEYNIGINYSNQNRIAEAIPWYQKAAKKGKTEAIDLLTNNGVAF
jgi:tetratricopeptide (TPR) repeat protein